MNKNKVQLANTVMSIVLDVWMLPILLWKIRNLNNAAKMRAGCQRWRKAALPAQIALCSDETNRCRVSDG